MSNQAEKNAIDWLLEPDDAGVRYLALRELVGADRKDLDEAKRKAHKEGPIAQVLANMHQEGYWIKPGPGYSPKYHGTVWSIILLAQLGASLDADRRVATACSYLVERSLMEGGQFAYNGTPAGALDCLQGNLCAALLDLGCDDPRLNKAFEWMARSVTGEGVAPMGDRTAPIRYYGYKCGPNFACGANKGLPCAWGAVKVMLAFSKLPKERRTNLIDKAISAGVEFLFSTDPARADYPTRNGARPSEKWWKFGFPVFYVADILQLAEALAGLGYGNDPRLASATELIRSKQDSQGRWPVEHDYQTWVDFGPKKQPNKWVTLRALRVLAKVA